MLPPKALSGKSPHRSVACTLLAVLISACGARDLPGVGPGFEVTPDGELTPEAEPADPISAEAYLAVPEAMGDDHFGSSIALDGDTLVIGCMGEGSLAGSDPASQPGAVRVFVRQAGTWSQEAYLPAPNPRWGQNFGFSVAVDGNTLAVGAPGDSSADPENPLDESAAQAGAVYVFQRAGSVWALTAYLKAPAPSHMERFGWSVALDGSTLAAYATEEGGEVFGGNPGGDPLYHSGAVHVFALADRVWSHEATLRPTPSEPGQRFGWSLALTGDQVAVGAPGTGQGSLPDEVNGDTGLPDGAGAAFLFARRAGVWSQRAALAAPLPQAYQYFGTSVALEDDTLVVGASGDAAEAQSTEQAVDLRKGAVYLYGLVRGEPSEPTALRASNGNSGDNFGDHVALDGDTLVVAASLKSGDSSTPSAGAVYAFRRAGDEWAESTSLLGSGKRDNFGMSLALDDRTLAVGSHYAGEGFAVNGLEPSLTQAGSVYIFTGL